MSLALSKMRSERLAGLPEIPDKCIKRENEILVK